MALLMVSGLTKSENGEHKINDISFKLEKFQKIAITGETGSGKTTLLKLIAGLIQPDRGEILLEGKKVQGPLEKLLPGHPQIAYLSQHFELRNNYRVEDELECSNLMEIHEAETLYSICRIQHLLKRKTNELSGGERQRIVLAKLLTTSPSLLLLDEPFSNLDILHKRIIKSVINDISAKLKITVLLVSHDASDILSWADSLLVIKEGQIIQEGNPEQVYRSPVNEYAAGLLGEYNLLFIQESGIFSSIPGIKAGKMAFIRPEYFLIVEPGSSPICGMVKNIQFRGHYYLLSVSIDDLIIQLITVNNKYKIGDILSLSVSPDDIWYF
ncbi:MAG: ABC transporter ATP-binding protein [Chitinophagaceae bacterium]